VPQLPTGTVTFLFTDVEGSTKLLQHLGRGYREVLEEHARLIRKAVREAGGTEVSTEGDAFFLVFPTAPEAVGAAVAVQRALATHPWPEGVTIRVRMGLHTGTGSLGGDNYLGIDVHRAARVASAAHGGQVLLSAATRTLVDHVLPEGATLRNLGEHRLKDLDQPEHLFQVVVTGLPADFPPPRSLDARPHNLPIQPTPFVGRREEVETVKQLLSGIRLLTLTGPGGAGKSRLALQVAAESLPDFRQGAFFVPLAPVDDPRLFGPTVAQCLGVSEVPDQPMLAVVRRHLLDKQLLLVLDNLEQLLGAAPQVAELLAAAPGLKALVTSRTVLHLQGEQEFPVPPLEAPDAVELFVQRARATDPSFRLDDSNAPAVTEIGTRLDGLPLAIELAAAKVKLFSPDALLDRLEHRLGLLRGGATDLPSRHQTLRDSIAWSHDLLEPREQEAFRRLGVFVGGFTVEAAEEVIGGDEVVEVIAALLDKSLLRNERGRLAMLETIREYALEQLAESDEREGLARRHAAFFLALAEAAEPHLTRERQGLWLDRLQAEHDNLRAALRWALETGASELGLVLAGSLWRFWHLRGHLTEGRRWLEELLRLPAASPQARAKGLTGLAGLRYWQGDYQGAIGLYEEAWQIFRELEDDPGIADTLHSLSYPVQFLGDHARTRELLEASRTAFLKAGDEVGAARAALPASFVAIREDGDHAEARRLLEESLELLREGGDWWGLANNLQLLGVVARLQGRLEEAHRLLEEALRLHWEAGDVAGIATVLDTLAFVAVAEEQWTQAASLSAATSALEESIGGSVPRVPLMLGSNPLEEARAHLSEEAFAAAYQTGRAMSLEEVLAYAGVNSAPATARPGGGSST
jgi:predicted ATPase/class 3 adenylate cyclase